MEHQFKLKNRISENGYHASFYEGYGYELKISYVEGEPTSRQVLLRPIKYKNEFHFNFNLKYDYFGGFEIENEMPVFSILHEQIDEVIQGFETAKLIYQELQERKNEFFPE